MPACAGCKVVWGSLAVVALAAGAFGLMGMQDASPTPVQPEAKPAQPDHDEAQAPKPQPTDPYVLGFTVQDIDGTDQSLAQYKGKVVMIVNVASKCGFTPQYKQLQDLYADKKDQGLVVLGFPANNFGKQEPGTNAEIKEFCSAKYGVEFPMFAKISVKGDDIAPLYKALTTQPEPIGGDIRWNFEKFLVDRKGNVVARFDSRARPDSDEVLRKIASLLAETDSPSTTPASPAPAGGTKNPDPSTPSSGG